jgi:hypothetical protein
MVAGMATSIQLYVVNTLDEAHMLQDDEPVDFYHDDDQCASCGVVVGFALSKFFPCVVCIDENDDQWIVCLECASGVISPEE